MKQEFNSESYETLVAQLLESNSKLTVEEKERISIITKNFSEGMKKYQNQTIVDLEAK